MVRAVASIKRLHSKQLNDSIIVVGGWLLSCHVAPQYWGGRRYLLHYTSTPANTPQWPPLRLADSHELAEAALPWTDLTVGTAGLGSPSSINLWEYWGVRTDWEGSERRRTMRSPNNCNCPSIGSTLNTPSGLELSPALQQSQSSPHLSIILDLRNFDLSRENPEELLPSAIERNKCSSALVITITTV